MADQNRGRSTRWRSEAKRRGSVKALLAEDWRAVP